MTITRIVYLNELNFFWSKFNILVYLYHLDHFQLQTRNFPYRPFFCRLFFSASFINKNIWFSIFGALASFLCGLFYNLLHLSDRVNVCPANNSFMCFCVCFCLLIDYFYVFGFMEKRVLLYIYRLIFKYMLLNYLRVKQLFTLKIYLKKKLIEFY